MKANEVNPQGLVATMPLGKHMFPGDLANQVYENWGRFVGGCYTQPVLATLPQLVEIFEVSYLVGLETDEGRALKLMLCCTMEGARPQCQSDKISVESWAFNEPREFNIQELRRLSASADLDSCAIWVTFSVGSESRILINGLVNIGRSWTSARNAFSFSYDPLPHAMNIRVLGPGRIHVYEGNYCLWKLGSGIIQDVNARPMMLDLHGINPILRTGHDNIRGFIDEPKNESPSEWHSFEFMAYVNSILAVVNSIQLNEHGGALILKGIGSDPVSRGFLRPKYRLDSRDNHLQARFIHSMNKRHRSGDLNWRSEWEPGNRPGLTEIRIANWEFEEAQRKVAQACNLIGGMASTDGAVIMGADLTVEGFGTEIVLDEVGPAKAVKVTNPVGEDQSEEFDSESKGMRHRSAIRLCAADPNLCVFVVSQDGGASLIWSREGVVKFMADVSTHNTNMILP